MKTKTTGPFKKIDNGWEIDTKVLVDGKNVHLHKRGYKTLADAKQEFERIKQEFIQSKTKHHEVMFFEDFIEEYKKMRSATVCESTQECDRSFYNVYLFPYFKKKLIKNVFNVDTIQNWYDSIVKSQKYSANKKSKVVTAMKQIIQFAWEHKFIDSETHRDCSVCLYPVKNSKVVQTERIIWTETEEHNFIQATKENPLDYIMFRTFIICACRIGEFLALQPKCFDYKNQKIKIMQQVKKSQYGGWELTDELKSNCSYRSIVLPKSICDMLQQYIDDFGLTDKDYLFHSSSTRTPMARTTFRRKLYYYCDIAGVRKCNPHAIRHQQAVKLISVATSSQDVIEMSHRLGHTPSVFMDTYANHKNEEKQKEFLNRLNLE